MPIVSMIIELFMGRLWLVTCCANHGTLYVVASWILSCISSEISSSHFKDDILASYSDLNWLKLHQFSSWLLEWLPLQQKRGPILSFIQHNLLTASHRNSELKLGVAYKWKINPLKVACLQLTDRNAKGKCWWSKIRSKNESLRRKTESMRTTKWKESLFFMILVKVGTFSLRGHYWV